MTENDDMSESMKRKNDKGIAIETIAYLVLGVVGLVLLWIFLSKTIPFISDFTESLIEGIRQSICNLLPIYVKWVFGC